MRAYFALSVAILFAVLPAAIGNPIEANNTDHLDNLDDFSLLIIFDMLDLSDLIKIASFGPRYQQLIADRYIKTKYAFGEKKIFLYVSGLVRLEYEVSSAWYPRIATGPKDVVAVLTAIGHIFKYMEVEVNPTGYEHVEEIQSAVNKYCSNAVQQVSILNRRGVPEPHTAFRTVNLSFSNAADITIINNDYFPNDPFQLYKAFPRMQKLKVGCNIDLHHHYPHLTDVGFYVAHINGKLKGYEPSNVLSMFLLLNPQLRRVKSPAYNIPSFLPSLSQLPNLESLSLSLLPSIMYTFSAPIARFRHVKELFLDVNSYIYDYGGVSEELLASLQFDRLESFTAVSCNSISVDPLFDMIVRYTSLCSVAIDAQISPEQVHKLIDNLPGLKKLTSFGRNQLLGLN